jgi:diguanylate cyclase (GGDEF)-like protein
MRALVIVPTADERAQLLYDKAEQDELKDKAALAERAEANTVAETLEIVETEATTDPLTGLLNRRGFSKLVFGAYGVELTMARDASKAVVAQPSFADRRDPLATREKSVGVVAFDIDHFKKINDTYGHAAGDLVLKEIARRIVDCVRERDFVARTGGEEFTVLARHCKDLSVVCEKIRAAIRNEPFDIGRAQPVFITVSVGAVRARTQNLNKAIEIADEALYISKETGRDRVTIRAMPRAPTV